MIQQDRKYFCSEKCRRAAYSCTLCGNAYETGTILIDPLGREEIVCEKCMMKPRCFSCAFPAPGSRLSDGRFLCDECRKSAVTSSSELHRTLLAVRRDLARYYHFDASHPVNCKFVTRTELEKATSEIQENPGSQKLAALNYSCDVEKTRHPDGRVTFRKVSEKSLILVLSHCSRDRLAEALAHELTHDYLRRNIGSLADLKLEEGFCEAVAGDYNLRRGHAELNLRKEKNPDPIYGDGYRMVRNDWKKNGFPAVVNRLRKNAVPLGE